MGKGGYNKGKSQPKGKRVDERTRHTGTVKTYNKLSGYGFISCPSGLVDGDEVFCHWKSITSDDRFPFLYKGLEVEFNLKNKEQGPVAWQVTLPGGGSIELQDESDAKNKEFVGGQTSRYSGTLKFYDNKNGYGYITLSGKVPVSDLSGDLRVEMSEVNFGGLKSDLPMIPNDTPVEFGIWKTKKEQYKAYNMCMQGGEPFTRDALEHRQVKGNTLYQGEISFWNWRQGWGFINPASANFQAPVKQALAKQAAAAAEKAKKNGKDAPANANDIYLRRSDVPPGTRLNQGSKVKFNIYVDDRGVGACNLSLA